MTARCLFVIQWRPVTSNGFLLESTSSPREQSVPLWNLLLNPRTMTANMGKSAQKNEENDCRNKKKKKALL